MKTLTTIKIQEHRDGTPVMTWTVRRRKRVTVLNPQQRKFLKLCIEMIFPEIIR